MDEISKIWEETHKEFRKGVFGYASSMRHLYYKKALIEYAEGVTCPIPKCRGHMNISMKKGKERYYCLNCGVSGNEETFSPQIKGDTFLAFLDRAFKAEHDKSKKKNLRKSYKNKKRRVKTR